MRQLSEAGLVGRLYWGLADSAVLIRRNLTHLARQRQLLGRFSRRPLVLFVYVFGGAISFVTRGDYGDYLLPGIVIMSVMPLPGGKHLNGWPISRAVVLIGRTGADSCAGLSVSKLAVRMSDWILSCASAGTGSSFPTVIFVPTFTMPSWLRPFAENQPLSTGEI